MIFSYLTGDAWIRRQPVVLVNPLLELEAADAVCAGDSEGWMRIPAILYGLYLIFLPGGRLNQQRLSKGQSASRRRVLHPLPLSAVFILYFFV